MKQQQKGGSVASDAVTSLVSADAYNQLSRNFTNHVGEQCGGALCKRCGRKVGGGKKKSSRKHHSVKKGGDGSGLDSVFKSFTNSASVALGLKSNVGAKSNFTESVFASAPAPAYNAVLPRNVGVQANAKSHFSNSVAKVSNSSQNTSKMQFADPIKAPTVGGNCPHRSKAVSGGNLRSMSELMARNAGSSYSIKNKRGGADTVGLNYNAIRTANDAAGATVDRSPNGIVDRLLATEQVPALPVIQKFTQYGSPLDTKMSFTYSGDRVSVAPPKSGGKSKTSHAKKAAKTLVKKGKSTKSASKSNK